ncbi:uncharacterized protein [Hemitrygon akajei]|uniref:uncharacterized protein n=1 Tax=Hemitrygon akajei TaxID=2704970 RepID=UPI003BF9B053
MDVGEFMKSPTMEALEMATKSDLLNLGKGLNLAEVKSSMKNREVRRAITQYYIGENVFEAEELENIPEKVPAGTTDQLEIERLRWEHEIKSKELEVVGREKERAETEKQRIHELELDRRRQERRAQGIEREEGFDVSRELRLVPPFEETDVDSYFLLFEKVAVNQKWPQEQWVALLQSVLAGGRIWAAMMPTRRPASTVAPPLESQSCRACAVTRSLSRKAAENESSLNRASSDLAKTFLPTLYHEGSEGGKTESSKVKWGKGKEIALPLVKRKVLEVLSDLLHIYRFGCV